MVQVVDCKYIDKYCIWLRFNDGTEGAIDLSQHLNGPMFEPLRDIEIFKQVTVDPVLATIVWPNGADLAPEFLKDNMH